MPEFRKERRLVLAGESGCESSRVEPVLFDGAKNEALKQVTPFPILRSFFCLFYCFLGAGRQALLFVALLDDVCAGLIVGVRGHSSVGRARALQARGHRFKPGCLHFVDLRFMIRDCWLF